MDCHAASFLTRSVWALVYSVFNWSRREERMLVFSSGLMTFSSFSNWASAVPERSILALNSSIWRSMKAERLADESKRILYVWLRYEWGTLLATFAASRGSVER